MNNFGCIHTFRNSSTIFPTDKYAPLFPQIALGCKKLPIVTPQHIRVTYPIYAAMSIPAIPSCGSIRTSSSTPTVTAQRIATFWAGRTIHAKHPSWNLLPSWWSFAICFTSTTSNTVMTSSFLHATIVNGTILRGRYRTTFKTYYRTPTLARIVLAQLILRRAQRRTQLFLHLDETLIIKLLSVPQVSSITCVVCTSWRRVQSAVYSLSLHETSSATIVLYGRLHWSISTTTQPKSIDLLLFFLW